MPKILMVAEKNSIAEAIAKALSTNVKVKKGRNVVLYFTGSF
jgi:DNA topoisomerase IA